MKYTVRISVITFCIVFLTTIFLKAQTFPTDFERVLVDDGLSSQTAFAFLPDGRILITEQTGKLRVIKDGSLLATPALTLTVNSVNERGLLGLAVDPDFENNQFVYLYYTVPSGVEREAAFNKVVRYTLNGDVATVGSATTILELDDLNAGNHNGGALNFGPDGKLYVAVGDNAVGTNSQNLDNYLGKILRINSDGSVPEGNPFTGNDARSRIWAYGLRNPYTFTFDSQSGKLFVNDVGEGSWEEINDATTGGLNFGWPSKEGVCNTGCTGFTNPIYAYGRGSGDGVGCAINGGTFFNPTSTNYPEPYKGMYFFIDFCRAWINCIDPSNPSVRIPFATSIGGGSTYIVTGPDGNLYYLSRNDEALYKVVYTGIVNSVQGAVSNKPTLVLAPNPSLGKVKIIVPSKAGDHVNVIVKNSQGKELSRANILEGSELDLSTLVNGMYLIQVDSYTTKWIKE